MANDSDTCVWTTCPKSFHANKAAGNLISDYHFTRRAILEHVFTAQTAVQQQSFAVSGPTTWNSLPPAPELSLNAFICDTEDTSVLNRPATALARHRWDVSTRLRRRIQMHLLTYLLIVCASATQTLCCSNIEFRVHFSSLETSAIELKLIQCAKWSQFAVNYFFGNLTWGKNNAYLIFQLDERLPLPMW